MPALHTQPAPRRLPFHAESFGWEHFERFCGAWFVSGTSLPNLNLTTEGPSRLRISDAVRYGTGGAKQRGIDILATMENRATWVVQCKHMPNFTRGNAQTAITKAVREYGSRQPARWLLWVTGKVTTDAIDLVQENYPDWTLWDGERLSQEFLLHTPPRQAFQVIESIFGTEWAKAFFPLPDSLLITAEEFFGRWSGEERLFHHRTEFVGRGDLLDRVTAFGHGGKGSKALILSAAGGIGKSRLLRAAAERIATEAPGRVVRFTNPEAPQAEPPRYEDAATLTVFHDDAHRIETVPPLLLGVMAKAQASGARLILATRPGAEDALRELLMRSGWQSQDIETASIKKLTEAERVELAARCLADTHPDAVRPLAQISEGCALITIVGAELLRRGDLTNLDLVRSDHFRTEVFHRFEGQELDRIRGSLDRPLMEKLLRSIALLSPWPGSDSATAQTMANFLGIQRGQVDAACDSLLAGGLLVRTRDGYRITPDLFSDHLAYAACYNAAGNKTAYVGPFLDHFAEAHSQTVLKNLAEAEWRALQQHGSEAASVVAPVWNRFLEDFTNATFWQRSLMLDHWTKFAFYQPERSLEIASWAMDLATAPPDRFTSEYDKHSTLLEKIPALLTPVAIWSDDHRNQALDLLWRLRRDFPWTERSDENSGYSPFATIASFKHNFPKATNGVLDWLEHLLAGPEAALAADRPSSFVETSFRPYFVRCIEQSYMQDRRTFVLSNIPVSVSKTKAVRQRAFRILTEQIIPRGAVAAINALPALEQLFHQPVWQCELSPAEVKAWLPEQRQTLQAIREVGDRYPHPLVHHRIRRLLAWHIVYGKHEEFQPACIDIVNTLPDTLELRLARLTLSYCNEDSLEVHGEDNIPHRVEQIKTQWTELTRMVASQLLTNHSTALGIHDGLSRWNSFCHEYGSSPQLSHLLEEIAQQDPHRAFSLLDLIHATTGSPLEHDAAVLIGRTEGQPSNAQEQAVLRGLTSANPIIVCSFLRAVQFRKDLQTERIAKSILNLAEKAEGPVLGSLIGMIELSLSTPMATRLIHAILQRTISDPEATQLSIAACRWASFTKDAEMHPETAAAILNRLQQSQHLKASDFAPGFIHLAAERFPRLLFEMLYRRLERAAAQDESDSSDFTPLPYYPELALRGLEQESDFENLARDLLKRVQSARSAQARDAWERLFTMSVGKISPLLEPLLLEWLPKINDVEELANLIELTKFESSLVIFRFPALTEAILLKAKQFGPKALNRITWALIHGAGPQGRGYTNGELDPEHRYLREESEKAVRLHEANPVLRPFFETVRENEVRDERLHRTLMEVDPEDW